MHYVEFFFLYNQLENYGKSLKRKIFCFLFCFFFFFSLFPTIPIVKFHHSTIRTEFTPVYFLSCSMSLVENSLITKIICTCVRMIFHYHYENSVIISRTYKIFVLVLSGQYSFLQIDNKNKKTKYTTYVRTTNKIFQKTIHPFTRTI